MSFSQPSVLQRDMPSQKHQEQQERQYLIDALVEALIAQGFEIDQANSGSYSRPSAIERHAPDIMARDPNGLVVIGLAKTQDDLRSDISEEQFIDFSSQIMASGSLQGKSVPFHVVVKKEAKEDLKSVLASLGLTIKIDDVIIIWTTL